MFPGGVGQGVHHGPVCALVDGERVVRVGGVVLEAGHVGRDGLTQVEVFLTFLLAVGEDRKEEGIVNNSYSIHKSF